MLVISTEWDMIEYPKNGTIIEPNMIRSIAFLGDASLSSRPKRRGTMQFLAMAKISLLAAMNVAISPVNCPANMAAAIMTRPGLPNVL